MDIDDVFNDVEVSESTKVAKIKLSSVPTKAQIYIWALDSEDAKDDGFPEASDINTGMLTPAIIPVYVGNGTRHIRLRREGYEDAVFAAKVEDRKTTNIDKQMYKLGAGPYAGILTITSNPSHAQVQIWRKEGSEYKQYKPDNQYVTPQPFFLPEGTYRVTVTKAGHRPLTFDEIEIKKGSNIEKNALLELIAEKGEELRLF